MRYSKLRGLIKEKGLTETQFGNMLQLSKTALSQRLNEKTSWKIDEIEQACRLLGIQEEEVPVYFFKGRL